MEIMIGNVGIDVVKGKWTKASFGSNYSLDRQTVDKSIIQWMYYEAKQLSDHISSYWCKACFCCK